MSLLRRFIVIVVLAGLVIGMGVHYDTVSKDYWPYPATGELAADYDRHVGETALLIGTVEMVDRGAKIGRIWVSNGNDQFRMTVLGFDTAVRGGGVVQVLGTLGPERTIHADRVAVVNPTGSSDRYKYTVSLVGAALVMVAFFRHWRVDVETYSFVAR